MIIQNRNNVSFVVTIVTARLLDTIFFSFIVTGLSCQKIAKKTFTIEQRVKEMYRF